MNWGLVKQTKDDGNTCWHVMPMVDIFGELVPSVAHYPLLNCPCCPLLSYGKGGWEIWTHFDIHHPGALSEEEWREMRDKSVSAETEKAVQTKPN